MNIVVGQLKSKGCELKLSDMIYKAMLIAMRAHDGQKDKAGMDYINHPLYLALQMSTEDETIVALLHDVIEDSNYTIDDLRAAGFNNKIIEALSLLTHDTKLNYSDYMDYIKGISNNSIATKVKIADLKHNVDISRLEVITDKDIKRTEKYKNAITMLMGEEIKDGL